MQGTDVGRLRLTDPDVARCPFPYFAQLHADGATAFDEGPAGLMVPGHATLSAIAKDPAHFSSQTNGPGRPVLMGVSPEPFSPAVEEMLARMYPMENALLVADAPTHTRQRAIVMKALNAGRVRQMQSTIRKYVDRAIDGFDDHGCEFVEEFATPLPISIIASVLGVEEEIHPTFKHWSSAMGRGIVEALDNEARLEVGEAVIEMQRYFLEQIASRRQRPTDDLLSDLVHAEIGADDVEGELVGSSTLSDGELLFAVMLLLAGGNHTTAAALGNLMVDLTRNPDVMAAVRTDRAALGAALEESLRLTGPVNVTPRVVGESCTRNGADFPRGSMVVMGWAAANHDPTVFPDPTRFDITRPNARRHLAFGAGPHFCVGANLARFEITIAFEMLLDRLEDVELVDAAPYEGFEMNGYSRIDLRFRKVR